MGHSYISCFIHYTFSTKGRAPIITPDIQQKLWPYMGGIARNNGMTAIVVGGTTDHTHVLIHLPSTMTVSKAVQLIKGGASKWMNGSFGQDERFEWQEGYGAFSVNISMLDATVAYIHNQPEHHRETTFQEEFLSFLKRHNIEYDPRYIWD